MGNCCSGSGASQAKEQKKPELGLPEKPAPPKEDKVKSSSSSDEEPPNEPEPTDEKEEEAEEEKVEEQEEEQAEEQAEEQEEQAEEEEEEEEEQPPEDPPKERLEALSSKEWKGYYIQNGNKGKMPKFEINFAEDANEEGFIPIEAEGEDDPGAYTISELFNSEDNSLNLDKDYEGRWVVKVELKWNEERCGFEGTFEVQGNSGEWFIKPVKDESSSSDSD